MNPKISIIVPVYKVETYLNKCIDSILEQTFKDFELILVDDGSPDRCGNICDEYAKRDDRIVVIHKDNGGISSARNVGLDIARGDYIGFVDSDDWIDLNMYKILFDNIKIKNGDMCVCDYKKVYSDNSLNIIEESNEHICETLSKIEALKKIYSNKSTQFIVVWNKLFKKTLFDNLKFEMNRIYEDAFIINELIYKSKKVIYLNNKLYNYRQREGSIMNSSCNIKELDSVYALSERVKFFYKLGDKYLINKSEVYYIEALLNSYRQLELLKEQNFEKNKLIKDFKKTIKIYSILNNKYFNTKEKIIISLMKYATNIYENYEKVERNKSYES
ncbi:glycosyltransferase family 2 protein [Terrisporobacter vanillatitrophus]|uniref:glycosyltransferase family 2 protein n=1 Tax=Terrisporobacter vanillatitrophus TaxID=3058402 RepID=UPI0033668EA7